MSTQAVFLDIGIDCSGRKQVLGLWIQQREGAKSWPQVLKQIRQRGVKDALIAVTDALPGFAPAIGAAFPKTQVQTCIVHWLRNSFAQVSCREHKALSTTLQCIYLALGAAAALRALQAFEGTELGRKYPGIARSWHAHWEQVTPCFSFTQTIRQLIYTTHAIERLNSCVRRAVATRGHFPSDRSATKLLYKALRKMERQWKRRPPFLRPARRELMTLFEDRFQVGPE